MGSTRFDKAALVILTATGCVPKVWTLQTEYLSSASVESAAAVNCSSVVIPAYGQVHELREWPPGQLSPVDTRELFLPLVVKISNQTEQVVTIDWEHSAFVDSSGRSYRVSLFHGARSKILSDAGPQTLDKPPVPVIAPGAHVEALVLPERSSPQPAMFFLPPYEQERAPLKFFVSVQGAAFRHVECVIRATFQGTRVQRSTNSPWPGHGDACLPVLGCADGIPCLGDVCQDPTRPPRHVKQIGANCEETDECRVGLMCDKATRTCQGRREEPDGPQIRLRK